VPEPPYHPLDTQVIPRFAGVRTFMRPPAVEDLRLAGCDVVEVSPHYDGPGQPTALAAANLLWELLALRAVAT
jgi:arginase family enzyme